MTVIVNKSHPSIVEPSGEPIAEVKVLDLGHLKLLMWAGTDRTVIQAARTSLAGGGTRVVSDDRALIRYMLRNRHTSPFEMVETWWEWKAPIHVFRQAHRHRTAGISEQSARYSEMQDEWYLPEAKLLNFQDPKNKQGRIGQASPHTADQVREAMKHVGFASFAAYQSFLGKENDDFVNDRCAVSSEAFDEIKENGGIAREIARNMLPLSTYSTMWWKCDLHNLLHFLSLRADSHAQYEIRQYAEAMAEIVAEMVPLTWEAFRDFRRDAMSLSACDQAALAGLTLSGSIDASLFPTKREREEFEGKLERLGLLGLLKKEV
jgi:thymidylate synthase (FAD)